MLKFKKASADEAQAKRKAHLKDTSSGLAVVKGFKAPPSWDNEKRSARFTMTSETADRYADIVVQTGLGIDNFLKNPTALLFHDSRSWPCGNWSDITKILNGRPRRTEGVLNFLPEGTDVDADRAARHVAAGSLRTVSIGFIPDWAEVDFILDEDDDWTGGFRFNKSELIECSLVPVPANPDALVKDAGGDMKLARDLIEDILDNYAKTPEGLLVPMDEYRSKHLDLSGMRLSIVVDKALLPSTRGFVPPDDLRLVASTEEEAKEFVGARVALDQSNPANKEFPFSEWQRDTGEIISSWIVSSGEKAGVHALNVEFLTDHGCSGMVRGVEASRFLLVKDATGADEAEEEPQEDGSETSEEATEETKSGSATEESAADLAATKDTIGKVKAGAFKIDLDTSDASSNLKQLSEEIDEVAAKTETMITRFKKMFGLFAEQKESPPAAKRIEPEVTIDPEEKSMPSADEMEAARAEARKALAKAYASGLIK